MLINIQCDVKIQGVGVKLPLGSHQLTLQNQYRASVLVLASPQETDPITSFKRL